MRRLPSLLRRAAIAAALSVAALGAASSVLCTDAFASGHGRGGGDTPDFDDDWETEDRDDDNSGPGGGDDWDQDWDDDRGEDHSGPSDGDDIEDDSSGHGGDDEMSDPGDADNHSDRNGAHHDRGDDDSRDHIADDVIYSVEYDSNGDEYARGEIVFVGTRQELALAANLGFRRIRQQGLSSGGVMARLRLPRQMNMAAALAAIAASAPNALVTPNSIYRNAQATIPRPTIAAPRTPARFNGVMGIIDTGVDAASLPAPNAVLSQRAFAGERTAPRAHGSMVASIAASRGVRVHVADVFGQSADGALAASAERIAAAIDWMISHRIAVVNISVEGPNNAILHEMIRRAAQRGHIIVAAAGNGGPAARPTFPAAFDGVLAVTAIDDTDRPYVRANRGDYIDFAAPGVDVNVDVGGEVAQVSGTSFAAPRIAAEAASHLQSPSPAQATRVVAILRENAEDLGEPGHDNIFGWGAVRD